MRRPNPSGIESWILLPDIAVPIETNVGWNPTLWFAMGPGSGWLIFTTLHSRRGSF